MKTLVALFITVESARAVGGRVYILLVIGDDERAAMLNALSDTPRPRVMPEAPEEHL